MPRLDDEWVDELIAQRDDVVFGRNRPEAGRRNTRGDRCFVRAQLIQHAQLGFGVRDVHSVPGGQLGHVCRDEFERRIARSHEHGAAQPFGWWPEQEAFPVIGRRLFGHRDPPNVAGESRGRRCIVDRVDRHAMACEAAPDRQCVRLPAEHDRGRKTCFAIRRGAVNITAPIM